jgi:hypothetical protein
MLLPRMAILMLSPRAIASRAFSCCGYKARQNTQSLNSALPALFVTSDRISTMKLYSETAVARFATAPSSNNAGQKYDRLRKMTVKQLKERLREEGLPTSGLKAELVGRLSARISPPSKKETSLNLKPPQPPEMNEIIDAIEMINPNWRQKFNPNAALRAEYDKNMAKKVESDDTITLFADDDATFTDGISPKRPINIMLFASEVPVIAGLNPYR